MDSVKETKEVLFFAADVILAVKKARADDGRVSMTEAVSMITLAVPALIGAVKGIGDLPGEAKTFTSEELEYLYDAFLTRLEWNPTDTNRDLAAAYFALVSDTYTNALRILNTHRPPKADPVP